MRQYPETALPSIELSIFDNEGEDNTPIGAVSSSILVILPLSSDVRKISSLEHISVPDDEDEELDPLEPKVRAKFWISAIYLLLCLSKVLAKKFLSSSCITSLGNKRIRPSL